MLLLAEPRNPEAAAGEKQAAAVNAAAVPTATNEAKTASAEAKG
jgi:hypothetical protein